MSDLYRLRELAALFQPKPTPVAESVVKPSTSFDGIKSIVDDALGDLHDKLGEGGALETLLDKADLTDAGSDIVEQLAATTEKFKVQIEKLMTEIELLIVSAE